MVFEAAFFRKTMISVYSTLIGMAAGSNFWAHCWAPAYLGLLLLLNCSPHNTIRCIYYALYYFVIHNTTLGVHLLPYTLMILSLWVYAFYPVRWLLPKALSWLPHHRAHSGLLYPPLYSSSPCWMQVIVHLEIRPHILCESVVSFCGVHLQHKFLKVGFWD